jgi:hypothetical protein
VKVAGAGELNVAGIGEVNAAEAGNLNTGWVGETREGPPGRVGPPSSWSSPIRARGVSGGDSLPLRYSVPRSKTTSPPMIV